MAATTIEDLLRSQAALQRELASRLGLLHGALRDGDVATIERLSREVAADCARSQEFLPLSARISGGEDTARVRAAVAELRAEVARVAAAREQVASLVTALFTLTDESIAAIRHMASLDSGYAAGGTLRESVPLHRLLDESA